MLTELFLNDQIDGFIADRLVGSRTIAELATTRQIHEYPLVVYQANVHAMFSRENFGPIDVEEFNHALESLISSGQHQTTLRHFAAPILLTNAISGNWFFVLDIIGTIAFAISGVLIARKEHYSLFGAFVLASLPAVGGGVIRDLLINREPIGILATPLYMYLIIGTVLTGYALNWILKFVRGRYLFIFDISVWIVSMSRYVLPRNVFEVFDAIGLAAFTVTGVAIASRYGADPLLIWGPLLAALTAAGGGILRDVFRADANNPALKTSFYAEIALCWGMLLSLFIYFRAMDVSTDAMRTAVVVTVVGAFATRMMIVALKLRSPQF
jgi:polar amino acid transport system substrate-binding protein